MEYNELITLMHRKGYSFFTGKHIDEYIEFTFTYAGNLTNSITITFLEDQKFNVKLKVKKIVFSIDKRNYEEIGVKELLEIIKGL